MSDNPFDLRVHIDGKDADELLTYLAECGAQPNSPVYSIVLTALNVRISEMQRDTARDTAKWAKWQGIGTLAAAIVALVALLVSAL